MTTTTFNTTADVQDFLGEHPIRLWMQEAARELLIAGQTGSVWVAGALRLIARDQEERLVESLGAGDEIAAGVVEAFALVEGKWPDFFD